MTTAIVLKHIEELSALQQAIKIRVVPLIANKLAMQPKISHLPEQ